MGCWMGPVLAGRQTAVDLTQRTLTIQDMISKVVPLSIRAIGLERSALTWR